LSLGLSPQTRKPKKNGTEVWLDEGFGFPLVWTAKALARVCDICEV